MKDFLTQMFSESSTISAMRVMAVISLLMGCGIAIYGIAKSADLGGISEVCAVFVGAAFTGKVVQKFSEAKSKKDSPDA